MSARLLFLPLLGSLLLVVSAPVVAAAPQQPGSESPAASAAPEVSGPLRVTRARLEAASVDACAACESVLTPKFDPPIALEFVEVSGMVDALAEDNFASFLLREKDEKKAKAMAKQFGQQVGPMLYAKYSWSSKRFLVAQLVWDQLAQQEEATDMGLDATLRAVLVHELCHAIDDRNFDLGAMMSKARTDDAVLAQNAVIEGHAQLQARRVCARKGWSKGMATLTRFTGAVPKSVEKLGEAMAALIRAQARTTESWYVDGEKFVKAVAASDSERSAARVFAQPPADMAEVLNPDWYLDPSKRPSLAFDVEPALDVFEASHDESVWRGSRMSGSAQSLAASFNMLDPEEAKAATSKIRQIRVLQLVPAADPQSKAAICAVLEFEDEASASQFVALMDLVSKHKDKTMTTGMLRILSSSTEKLEFEGMKGFLQSKTMRNGALEFPFASIDAQRGCLLVETIFSGDPPEQKAHLALVKRILDAAKAR